MPLCCCSPFDENDGDSGKRQWWVRIGVTLLILVLIVSMVLAGVLYREHRESDIIEVQKSDDDEFETFAKRILQDENKLLRNKPNNMSGTGVFSEHPFCAETGSKVLSEGGSAVDCAVAMLFCQGVVEPHHSGLGGGFLMLIYIREKKQVVTLDARARAPFYADPRMFERFYHIEEDKFDNKERQGWLTVGVPGEALGLWEAHQKYGKLPWQRLVDPSIRLASHGFPISNNLAKYLALYNATVQNSPQLKKVFVNPETNEIYKEGDDIVNENLAKVLMRIASEGTKYLYNGDVAVGVTDESLKNAGIFSHRDFSEYDVTWSVSLPFVFKDEKKKLYTLHMPPPPSSAIMIGMILNIVQSYENELLEENIYSQSRLPQLYHRFVEAMKHVFARRELFGDSSNMTTRHFFKFLSPHWGLKMHSLISPTNTFLPQHYKQKVESASSRALDFGTANVAAVAANGDVVVASSTLNDPFGSGVVSEDFGFLLNNNMLSFALTKNGSSVISGGSGNSVIPHKRPLTSLCPVIILDEEENFKLVIAGSGGIRIPTSISLILMRYFWLNDDISKAANAFRFHHQLIPNTILYEGTDKEYDIEYLRAYGHNVQVTSSKWPHVNILVQENETIIIAKDNHDNL